MNKIRHYREQLRLSQTDIAQLFNITQKQLSKVEQYENVYPRLYDNIIRCLEKFWHQGADEFPDLSKHGELGNEFKRNKRAAALEREALSGLTNFSEKAKEDHIKDNFAHKRYDVESFTSIEKKYSKEPELRPKIYPVKKYIDENQHLRKDWQYRRFCLYCDKAPTAYLCRLRDLMLISNNWTWKHKKKLDYLMDCIIKKFNRPEKLLPEGYGMEYRPSKTGGRLHELRPPVVERLARDYSPDPLRPDYSIGYKMKRNGGKEL